MESELRVREGGGIPVVIRGAVLHVSTPIGMLSEWSDKFIN